METTKIAELAKILKDTGLTKLDLTEGDNRLVHKFWYLGKIVN